MSTSDPCHSFGLLPLHRRGVDETGDGEGGVVEGGAPGREVDDLVAIGGESNLRIQDAAYHAAPWYVVPGKEEQFLTGVGVPDLNAAELAAASEAHGAWMAAIGAEGDTLVDHIVACGSINAHDLLAGFEVDDAQGLGVSEKTRGTGQSQTFAIRTPSRVETRFVGEFEGAQGLAVGVSRTVQRAFVLVPLMPPSLARSKILPSRTIQRPSGLNVIPSFGLNLSKSALRSPLLVLLFTDHSSRPVVSSIT